MAKHTTSLNPTNSDSKPCLDFLRKNCNKRLDQKNVVTEITTTKVFLKPPQFPKKTYVHFNIKSGYCWESTLAVRSPNIPPYAMYDHNLYIYTYIIYIYVHR